MNTPSDMLQIVLDSGREYVFLSAMMRHTGDYSIGEIADGHFKNRDGRVSFYSTAYDIHTRMDADDEITGAVQAGRHVSAFISRHHEKKQLHFIVHDCLEAEKASHEDEIARKCVQYMIFQTILTLRLDTRKKLENYMEGVY